MSNKILILGKGQLGQILQKELILKYDITINTQRVETLLKSSYSEICFLDQFDVIINTIAESNTRVCEKNYEPTLKINTEFPIWLAKQTNMFSNKLIHISSGCIFDGNTMPHYENSNPTPKITYARQKLMAETLLYVDKYATILRPRMLFSELNIESNLIKKISKFPYFLNEKNSMTSCKTIAFFIDKIIEHNLNGMYNVCNKGFSSAFEIKQLINKIWKLNDPIFEISKQELHQKLHLELTDTWIDSNYVSSYYDVPDVQEELIDVIKECKWLIK